MADLGIKNFQQLIGRTDLLEVTKNLSDKAATLDFSLLLKNALDLRSDKINIIGGSVAQDFGLEKRADNDLIIKAQPVIDGTKNSIEIVSTINNEERTYSSTLSYHIAW